MAAIIGDPQATLEFELEQLIDKHGLANVLEAVQAVCDDKAEHIRSNYSERDRTAGAWEQSGRLIAKTADRVRFKLEG